MSSDVEATSDALAGPSDMVADQPALESVNAQLFQEARALYRAALALGGELDLTGRLERVLDATLEVTGFNQVQLALVDTATHEIEVVAARGQGEYAIGVRQPLGGGLTGAVVALNAPVRSGDVGTDPRTWDPSLARKQGMRSWMGVPLADGPEVLGVLTVLSAERDVFTEEDERRLAALAALAGAAVREARLYQQAQEEIAERRRVEEALRESQARLDGILSSIDDVIWAASPDDFRLLYLNPAAETVYGRPVADFMADPSLWFAVVHPDDREWMILARDPLFATNVSEMEYRIVLPDGGVRWLSNRIRVVRDADGTPIRLDGISRDVTERKRAEDVLQHRALHDALTDLPNRVLLRDRLVQALLVAQRHAQSVALLVMDLDRFKDVNDTLGHQAGDLLLQQVARRLQDTLRASDTVARLGGDEFAVILPVVWAETIEQVAHKLLHALDAPFIVEGHVFQVGASIGAALYPTHGDDPETLLRRADVAMYVAKRAGSGFAVYSTEQDQHSSTRLAMIGELRQAIASDELLLHYQPRVELRSRRTSGVEALARWPHPQRGNVPPDQFIPLAEQTGLIQPLTEWVLCAALRQSRDWRAAGLDVPVAVNLSMRNLHDPQLPEALAGLLREWEVPPGSVRLEVTESAVMQDPARALEILTQIRALGISIAIDDFGTGYSSLAYLKRLPVDELKVDKSFVQDMLTDESDRAIVRATIDLAHTLGLRVVAEGVEDQATLELLAGWGCDEAQGFWFSRPLPAADLVRWLDESPWGLAAQPQPRDA